MNGHCDYVKGINKNQHKFHMANSYKYINNNLESKALEMDAYTFATCALLDEISNMFKINDKIFTILNEKIDIYAIYTMAIQGGFYLLENNWQGNTSFNTHQPANVRGIMCVERASRKLSTLGLNISELLITSTHRLMEVLTLKNSWTRDIIAYQIVEDAKEFQKILNYLKNILSEKLRPYTYVYVESVNFYLLSI